MSKRKLPRYEELRPGYLLPILLLALLLALLLVLLLAGCAAAQAKDAPAPEVLRALRIAKASQVVRAGYSYGDERDFLPYVPYLVRYHEYLEGEAIRKGKPGQGYAAAYWWSLVYGGANFSLKCHRSAPGNCRGPLDVKGKRGSGNPQRNIEYHCQEMLTGYLLGYRGLGLCEYVMMPNAPRGWSYRWDKSLRRSVDIFERTDMRHRVLLARWYEQQKTCVSEPSVVQ